MAVHLEVYPELKPMNFLVSVLVERSSFLTGHTPAGIGALVVDRICFSLKHFQLIALQSHPSISPFDLTLQPRFSTV